MKDIGSTSELNSQFSAAGSKLVVIDFHATWCGPCKHLAPILEALERKHKTTIFVKVDVDQARDVATQYTITSMPTLVFVKNRSEVGRVVGGDTNKIQALIKEHESGTPFSGTGQTLGGGSSSAVNHPSPSQSVQQRGGGSTSSTTTSSTATTTASMPSATRDRRRGGRDLDRAPYYYKLWFALTHLATTLMQLLYQCFQGLASSQANLVDSVRTATTSTAAPAGAVSGPGGSCQIQVRLLDGSTIKGSFEPSHTVENVHDFVKANLQARGAALDNFSLMTNFPRVVYEGDTLKQTLEEAKLTPRAQLIVKA